MEQHEEMKQEAQRIVSCDSVSVQRHYYIYETSLLYIQAQAEATRMLAEAKAHAERLTKAAEEQAALTKHLAGEQVISSCFELSLTTKTLRHKLQALRVKEAAAKEALQVKVNQTSPAAAALFVMIVIIIIIVNIVIALHLSCIWPTEISFHRKRPWNGRRRKA